MQGPGQSVWLNASAAPGAAPPHATVVLVAALPPGVAVALPDESPPGHVDVDAAAGNVVNFGVTGTSYGYGPIPMMNLYTAVSNLPVMPWNSSSEVVRASLP